MITRQEKHDACAQIEQLLGLDLHSLDMSGSRSLLSLPAEVLLHMRDRIVITLAATQARERQEATCTTI